VTSLLRLLLADFPKQSYSFSSLPCLLHVLTILPSLIWYPNNIWWSSSLCNFHHPPVAIESRDSSVGMTLGYGLDDRGSRVRFTRGGGLGVFPFTTASRTALGLTQPPIQWVPGALSLGVKRPGREADRSPQSSAEVKEWLELYLHSPNTPSWCGAQLKHRDNFTFT
jgi:hypothetical protein